MYKKIYINKANEKHIRKLYERFEDISIGEFISWILKIGIKQCIDQPEVLNVIRYIEFELERKPKK